MVLDLISSSSLLITLLISSRQRESHHKNFDFRLRWPLLIMEKMKKIGYTTGVFDMFHVGHLNLIKRAKLECDYLIVGVSTDELVWKKKKEPIIPFVERLAIVEHIEFVDEVVQSNMNKLEAWENFRLI